MDRDAQLLASAPHWIPAWVGEMRKRLGHLSENIDAAMANGDGPGNLPGNRLGVAEIGKNSDWQIAVADTSPFPEGIVVGSDHLQLEGNIAELKVTPAGRIGKEHFRVDAVAIQSLQPFPRIIGGPWDLFPS